MERRRSCLDEALARARACEAPRHLVRSTSLVWERRWTRMLSTVCAVAFAASLVDQWHSVNPCVTRVEDPRAWQVTQKFDLLTVPSFLSKQKLYLFRGMQKNANVIWGETPLVQNCLLSLRRSFTTDCQFVDQIGRHWWKSLALWGTCRLLMKTCQTCCACATRRASSKKKK